MSKEIPFEPFPFLDSPHHQTIVGSLFNVFPEPESIQKVIHLEDGDQLILEVTTPKDWKPTDPTVMLVHGMCGSHQSSYMVRMANRLEPLGIRVVRFNLRGCGSGKGLARYTYHRGKSEDVFRGVRLLNEETPDSPISLVGFSLGGNIVLKLAGELQNLANKYFKKVIAVSPPVDLYSSILMFGQPENAMYEKYFYRLIRKEVYELHKMFPDLPAVVLPKNLKLYEFDEIYTAPRCGFLNAYDYYSKCSSLHLISEVAVPSKILLAEDDPIVSSTSLDRCVLPSNISVFKTKKGGHLGYLGNPLSEKGYFWLDSLLEDWILKDD